MCVFSIIVMGNMNECELRNLSIVCCNSLKSIVAAVVLKHMSMLGCFLFCVQVIVSKQKHEFVLSCPFLFSTCTSRYSSICHLANFFRMAWTWLDKRYLFFWVFLPIKISSIGHEILLDCFQLLETLWSARLCSNGIVAHLQWNGHNGESLCLWHLLPSVVHFACV